MNIYVCKSLYVYICVYTHSFAYFYLDDCSAKSE